MNKAQLIEEIQKILKGSKADAERALNAVLEAIKRGIKKDKVVQLVGFGTFELKKRAPRNGINPQTGEKIKIKASKTIKFKAGSKFKKEAA